MQNADRIFANRTATPNSVALIRCTGRACNGASCTAACRDLAVCPYAAEATAGPLAINVRRS
jgi:hypothetical protein